MIPSANKNAVLPILCATLLTDEPVTLRGVPDITDARQIIGLFERLGSEVDADFATGTLRVRHAGKLDPAAARLPEGMRSSIMLIPALLARLGEARIEGDVKGCSLGVREIDPHIEVFQTFGVEVAPEQGALAMTNRHRIGRPFAAASHWLDYASVTTTENFVLCAATAEGTSTLTNAASEPHVQEFCAFLAKMGAKVEGAGTSTITITGVDKLRGATHAVIPDRIETGTYAVAAAMAGGEVRLTRTRADFIQALLDKIEEAGADVIANNDGVTIRRNGARLKAVDIETDVYPGLATDLQAQFMALMTLADGESVIRETIFENRFMHVPELARLGADISVQGGEARVRGVGALDGAQVMATDLRASVSLVIAGLAARGETVVNRVYHLDRGFERLEQKLGACGAPVRRLKDDRADEG